MLVVALALLFLSIVIRFDFLKGEWKTHLSFYKFYYHLEQNNSFEHGLTEENDKKLSILAKFTEIIFLKGCVPMICTSAILIMIYIGIKSNKFLFELYVLVFIYDSLLVASTFALLGSIALMTFYYYKLLFDQINGQIHAIYMKSRRLTTLTISDQKRLYRLVKQHDLRGQQINQLNIIFRQTDLVLLIVLAII